MRDAVDAFGDPVDILVNNAAAARHFELGFEHMTADEFRRQVEVNVWAAWDLALSVLPGMRARGAGWIVNVSSMGAAPKVGPPYTPVPMVGAQCLYGSTKAMLDRWSTGAAMELAADGIAVNTLAPEGAVATDNAMTVASIDPKRAEPLETMAEATLALCSGDPRILTGRVTTSLSLLVELGRPVWSLDGRALVDGWQPGEIDPAAWCRATSAPSRRRSPIAGSQVIGERSSIRCGRCSKGLAALRVVDFSSGIPGAYCCRLLADAGADVVKVEAPEGDPWRSWSAGGGADSIPTRAARCSGSSTTVSGRWSAAPTRRRSSSCSATRRRRRRRDADACRRARGSTTRIRGW